LDAAELIVRIAACEGERWCVRDIDERTPLFQDHHDLPGVFVRDHRYWAGGEENLTVVSVTGRSFQKVACFEVAFRRWLTRRMAHVLNVRGLLTSLSVDRVIVTMSDGRSVRVSGEALVAARALVAESKLNSPKFPALAGHIGPDEWFM